MSYRNREIESKWLISGVTLDEVRLALEDVMMDQVQRSIFGSSVDTYWNVPEEAEAQFVRMRERDGIRQVTVKARDRGSNINRLEVDVDSTSDVSKITRLLNALFGKPAGKVGKTYHVYWPGDSEHTTICAYSITHVEPNFNDIVVEIETISESKLRELEETILGGLEIDHEMVVRKAAGSLFELFITKEVSTISE